jgi:hypothetical protein
MARSIAIESLKVTSRERMRRNQIIEVVGYFFGLCTKKRGMKRGGKPRGTN